MVRWKPLLRPGWRCAVRAVPMLAFCGCAGYSVNGTLYRTSGSALKAQANGLDEQVSSIRPLGYVGGSVLVVLPGDEELSSPPFAERKVHRLSAAHSYLVRFWRRDIAAAAEALTREEAFDGAEMRRTDDPVAYAREYGYRFILRDYGPRWLLDDTVTGRRMELHGVGLKDLGERAAKAAVRLQAARASPVARSAVPAPGDPQEDKTGGLTLRLAGGALEARARILARIRGNCSGAYRISDEFLQEGVLTLRFHCLGQRVSCASCGVESR